MSWRDEQLEEGVLRNRAFLGRGESSMAAGSRGGAWVEMLVDLVPICEQRCPRAWALTSGRIKEDLSQGGRFQSHL